MRYLVFYKTALLRHFGATLVEVADRGHEVVLASPHRDLEAKIPGKLRQHENVRVIGWKSRRKDREYRLSSTLAVTRNARDYLRYLDPQLSQAWANRERAWKRLVRTVTGRSRHETPAAPWFDLTPTELQVLKAAFAQIEELAPPNPLVCESLLAQAPDAVLLTPLIGLGSGQTDIVAACRALGIPCGLLVFSWDNLSNKGVMHVIPDKVFVWNEVQAREAVEFHGVPREDVVVAGAPRFDEFFDMSVSTSRKRFLRKNRLDPERKTVLYLGSAPFVSAHESVFVRRWLDELRGKRSGLRRFHRRSSAHAELRDANVFIRPHPRTHRTWLDFTPERWENVAIDRHVSIYRLGGLYNQIAHCDAVVGLNTSAQLEAAILGKPVYTVDAGELAPGQEGSTHYYYLLRENGGFVEHGRTMEQHLDQLAAGLRGEYDAEAIEGFARSFLRPRGLELPAAPILAKEIVSFAEQGQEVRASRESPLPQNDRDPAPVPVKAKSKPQHAEAPPDA